MELLLERGVRIPRYTAGRIAVGTPAKVVGERKMRVSHP